MRRQLEQVSITVRHKKTGEIAHIPVCSCGWIGNRRPSIDDAASDLRIHVGIMRHHPSYRDGKH